MSSNSSNGFFNLQRNAAYFIGFNIFFIAGLLLFNIKGKADSFVFLNTFHSHWLDTFFIYFTNVGDGLFVIILALLFFFVFKKKKHGLLQLLGWAFSGLIAQLIKHFVFSPRPEPFFAPVRYPFFIDHIILSGSTSFPSGHTATAFAAATILVLLNKKTTWQLPILFLAILVAYSRVYLSQHFLLDVLAGSFIGTLCGIICVYASRYLNEDKLNFKRSSK